jgi:transposase-like protein
MEVWAWEAVESYLKCFLAFYVSWERNSLSARLLLKELRRNVGSKTKVMMRLDILSL